ncbi:MAG: phosphoglycerate dehydrogenase [Phycisphaerae bacterium]|nr:phosphoglycerate dehydrogenase [Phycisphaerae bacterium]
MLRILVADKLAEEGLERLRRVDNVTFDVRIGLPPNELAACIGKYDGLIVRSGVKVTADVLAQPGRLQAIARAGVGVDNVDLAAATRAGVLVMNTPDANTISTAEHTIAMILALARHIPAACAELKSGQWNRAKFEGSQLAGKTLGLVGLGRVGRAVAARALALEMSVIAYDPFVQADPSLEGRVRIAKSLDVLLDAADYLSVHAVLTDATRGMIGAAEFARMKPGVRIINCARGGIIDEAALVEAIRAGRVAGAALDVFASEPPPEDSALLALPQVVCTPHLGASTIEAQAAVAVEAVDALLDFLLREQIRGACNVVGLPRWLSPPDRAYIDLASRMGALLASLCDQGIREVTLTTHGSSLAVLAPALARFASAALLAPYCNERLNVINVEEFARSRGIVLRHVGEPNAPGPTDRVSLAVEGGEQHTIHGTVFADLLPRILSIDDYPMNLVPAGTMLLIFNDDRPGVIGFVGTTLGNLGVNIADMALSRHADRALMVLRLDAPPPREAVQALQSGPSILSLRFAALPPNVSGAEP